MNDEAYQGPTLIGCNFWVTILCCGVGRCWLFCAQQMNKGLIMWTYVSIGLVICVFTVLTCFVWGSWNAEKIQDKWGGKFALILNDGTSFSCTAGQDTRLYHPINGHINSVTLLSAPAGKLPLVEIGYDGQIHDFRMFRNRDGVELNLTKPIEPSHTPTDLIVSFEVDEDQFEVVTIEIQST
ncbi:MAG: hypothetical protein Q7S57_02235 [bacterium]|nr:hypothetical protein [bacterium]